MLFGHGLGKLQRILSGNEIKFLDPFGIGATASLYLATFAEFFASILIVIGLFTRIGSIALIVTMSVAAFIAHSDDPFSGQEKSLMYLVSYVLLFLTGPGKYSFHTIMKNMFTKVSGPVKFFIG
jgi:putative oxidoreductase